jgi:hypothetical protein
LHPVQDLRERLRVCRSDHGQAAKGTETIEDGALHHDAPELTEAVEVVVVGAAVVVVVDATTPLEVEVDLELSPVAEGERLLEDPDVAAAVVEVGDEALVDELSLVEVVDVDEAEARTVWPANSLRPMVPSSDPPANQKVTARALRIPRRRLAPVERSPDRDMRHL